MAKKNHKSAKKLAKAEVKKAKANAKARQKTESLASDIPELKRLPQGVGISVRQREDGSELVLTGLRDEQLRRIVPQLTKEVLITVAEDKSALRASFMRFVREGAFQTLVKVLAGLIVGFLLLQFGLR